MLFIKKTCGHVIGIDEAGRGPLAGPLVVGGVRVSLKSKVKSFKFFKGIRDSKQLSAGRREKWFKKITANAEIRWAVARISPGAIDKINILRAAHRGAEKVYQKLNCGNNCRALLDGSLALPCGVPHRVYIKGDERFPIISAASIIAKVTRDRLMERLHQKYPVYGFNAHKGYGTKAHYAAIAKFGISDIHRRTFKGLLPNVFLGEISKF